MTDHVIYVYLPMYLWWASHETFIGLEVFVYIHVLAINLSGRASVSAIALTGIKTIVLVAADVHTAALACNARMHVVSQHRVLVATLKGICIFLNCPQIQSC